MRQPHQWGRARPKKKVGFPNNFMSTDGAPAGTVGDMFISDRRFFCKVCGKSLDRAGAFCNSHADEYMELLLARSLVTEGRQAKRKERIYDKGTHTRPGRPGKTTAPH